MVGTGPHHNQAPYGSKQQQKDHEAVLALGGPTPCDLSDVRHESPEAAGGNTHRLKRKDHDPEKNPAQRPGSSHQ
jgi:hypothetical protein